MQFKSFLRTLSSLPAGPPEIEMVHASVPAPALPSQSPP